MALTVMFLLVLVSVSCTEAFLYPMFPPIKVPDGYTDNLVYDGEGKTVQEIPRLPDPPIVTTPQGRIQGTFSKLGARVFKSIPFAQPPVGSLRWQDPRDVNKFKQDPLMATEDSNICPQSCIVGCGTHTVSEDCLYLNIYAPPNAKPDSPYPVMVFIHGGAFIGGYAPIFDGDYIASNTGTIVVTFNYRLGVLGFLNFEEEGTGKTIDGNFGLKDQQKAMKWVKDNIANFGGDDNRITLFGESAGASSVGIHMTNPESAQLFNQTIIESDPFSIEYLKVPKARDLGGRFAHTLDCDSIKCLKDKSFKEIVNMQLIIVIELLFHIPPPGPFKTKFQLFMAWAPVVDGEVLTDQPVKLFASSKLAANVPLIIGTNSEEARLLALPVVDPVPIFNPLVYHFLVGILFNKNYSDQVIEQYPPKWWPWNYQYNRDLFAKLFTDYMFVCPTRHAVENVNTGKGKWVYIFDQPYTHKAMAKYCEDYSCHTDELPYVFHTTNDIFETPPTDDELRLEEIMMTYWVNFAHNGDPNIHYDKAHDKAHATLTSYIKQINDDGIELVEWPDFSQKRMRMFNTAETGVENVVDQYPQKDKCDFFDDLIGDYNMCFDDDC